MNSGSISHALVDEARIPDLPELWREAIPEETEDQRMILSVDAIAFPVVITPYGDGNVRGLITPGHLENPDLFSPFVANQEAFLQFFRNQWDKPVHRCLFINSNL
jgi:hypothetical protein